MRVDVKNYTSKDEKIMDMNEKLFVGEKNSKQSNNIFQDNQLEFSNYKKINEEPRKRVTKWAFIFNNQYFAFKNISKENKNIVQNEVTILKEFQDWQNIGVFPIDSILICLLIRFWWLSSENFVILVA